MQKKFSAQLYYTSVSILKQYILLIITLSLFLNTLSAQPEKMVSKAVIERFANFYNHENYDSIFYLFSPEMQQHLPLDKTTDFLTGLKNSAGKIIKRQFIKYEQVFASYKTNFEHGLFAVNYFS